MRFGGVMQEPDTVQRVNEPQKGLPLQSSL